MGSAASAENRSRLQNADRKEFLNIMQEISTDTQEEDLSDEQRQHLLKALEVQDTKEIKESASDAHEEKDTRGSVESMLKSTLADSQGILPRESWIEFLKVIGGREQDGEALLKEQNSHLSVEEFLNIIFGPKEPDALLEVPKEENKITATESLRDYFEQHYRNGGEFRHPDYEPVPDADLHTWMHKPTGIQVWRDAIDLTSGEGGEVYFHYTSTHGFFWMGQPAAHAASLPAVVCSMHPCIEKQ